MSRQIIELECEKCEYLPKPDKNKSNKNWLVFDVDCPKCGGRMKIRKEKPKNFIEEFEAVISATEDGDISKGCLIKMSKQAAHHLKNSGKYIECLSCDRTIRNKRLKDNCDALVKALRDLVNWVEPRLADKGGITGCRENNLCVQCKAKHILTQVEKEGRE